MKKIKGFYADNQGVLYGTGKNPKKEFIQNQVANEIMKKNQKKSKTKKSKIVEK